MLTLTREIALKRLAAYIEIQGLDSQRLRLDGFCGFYKYSKNIWADEANLEIRLDWDGKIKVALGWSSTNRTPAMARVAIENYLEALKVADRIQAFGDTLGPVETIEEHNARKVAEKEEAKS